jgi:hypothetical protein
LPQNCLNKIPSFAGNFTQNLAKFSEHNIVMTSFCNQMQKQLGLATKASLQKKESPIELSLLRFVNDCVC